jgi:acyl transferase domain-containing protein
MGVKLYEHNYIFKDSLNKASEILKELDPAYPWLIDEIYNNSVHLPFKNLQYTHPAIIAVEYALYQALIAEGIKPDYLLGSSLGEFTAAVAAESCSLRQALFLSLKQAKLIEDHCLNGGLTAVLGPVELYKKLDLSQKVALAGINFDNHFTIAALDQELSLAESYLREKEVNYQRLPVEYGFHSSRIDRAEFEFKESTRNLRFNNPGIPILSGYDGTQIREISQDYFWNAVRNLLNFQKIIQKLEQSRNAIYVDLTPNGTLANFVKYNLGPNSKSKYYSILSAFNTEIKNLKKLKEELPVVQDY